MARPRKDPVKSVARAILALTVEQRNVLDVALSMIEEFAPALGSKSVNVTTRRKAVKVRGSMDPAEAPNA